MLFSEGIAPEQKTNEAACYDLFMPCDGCIEPGKIMKVNLKIGFEFQNPGFCLHMYGRSSAFGVHGLFIPTTIIDADYRGPVHLIMSNANPHRVSWKRGDRLCQIQVVNTIPVQLLEVEELSETIRSQGGIGSTGL